MAIFESYDMQGNAWVTKVLLGANILVFLVQMFAFGPVIYWFAMFPSDIIRGQFLWTLLSNMFLHADVVHIFFNMYALYIFGNDVEYYFGHIPFLVLYLFWGFFANLFYIGTTFFLTPWWINVPTIGASGAVFGVMIAYAVAYPQRILTGFIPFPIRTTARRFVLLYIVIETVYFMIGPVTGVTGGGVAHAAHLGGALAGYLSAQYIQRKRFKPQTYTYYDYSYR